MSRTRGDTEGSVRSVRPIQHDIYRNKKVFKINNIAMRRHAFKMKLKPGNKEEYKKRHDEIWPELEQALKETGIHNYSIFLDEETNTLFAVHKLDKDHTSEQLPKLPVMKKWWDFMADIMEVNPDNSPVTKPLKEVFYME